ncbi:MAG TPA: PadR family transcriptional regulator [Candidatus Saccharimonadales bacterium]|nr:PadR family transcriptional regulator [Candidatus Saccharimonadales bacterium]
MRTRNLDEYERKLLESWEDVYKKGQLTLWIMLALKDGPKHMEQIKVFIGRFTNDTMVADDKSLYRALRRYYDAEMVNFKQVPSKGGPDLKIYSLNHVGNRVLETFIRRNILEVFFQPRINELIKVER